MNPAHASAATLSRMLVGVVLLAAAAWPIATTSPASASETAPSITCHGDDECNDLIVVTNDCEGGGWSTNHDGSRTCTYYWNRQPRAAGGGSLVLTTGRLTCNERMCEWLKNATNDCASGTWSFHRDRSRTCARGDART